MTTIFSGVDMMSRALDFHLERQNMIAANVANVDTPGYAPRELVRPDAKQPSEFLMALYTSHSRHIANSREGSGAPFNVIEERNTVAGNDLNYVSLEHEMSRLSANTLRFQAVGKLVSKQLGILSYAASDARR